MANYLPDFERYFHTDVYDTISIRKLLMIISHEF